MLQEVRHLVAAGFAVHRLHAKAKRPIGDDWASKPVLSFEALQATYRANENLGVRLGKWSKIGGGYLLVIDLDVRDPSRADEARRKLDEILPGWKSFPRVVSGSGGSSRHVYLIADRPFTSKKLAHSEEKIVGSDGKKHWAWEIELFGTGKQVVLPPSIHPDTGKPYRWEERFDFEDIAFGLGPFVSTAHLEELTGDTPSDASSTDESRAAPIGLSHEEIRQVLADIPAAEYCDDRDGWLTVGMALHHEFGGSNEGFEFWCEFSKRSEKFDVRDQKRVWRSFKSKNRAKPVRMATLVNAAREARLEGEFDNLDDIDPLPAPAVAADMFDDLLGGEVESAPKKVSKREQKLARAEVEHALGHVPKKIVRINRKHAVAFIKGKTVIITENRDGSVSYGSVHDLHAFYENDRVATEQSTEAVTKAWMRHKARREYPNGVVFAPGEDIEGAYNHWRGFAVEPDPSASCRLILDHIRTVVANGEEESYRYIIGWLAHMIQQPADKPGVAIVVRGLKGTGKDTLGDYMGGLFPEHHIKIANQEHFVGRFNQHQEKCLLLHVEEGFWAGNKQAESSLKHLITSEKVFIEPKGLNGFHVTSVLRLFISSNEEWVVPATEDERRYAVFDVNERWSLKKAKASDRKTYFDAIRHEARNGGRAALLHFLMTYDLSQFDVRDVPNTSGLAAQKVQGLKNIERWWYGLIQNAEPDFAFFGQHGEDHADWNEAMIKADFQDILQSYGAWMRTRRFDGPELPDYEIAKRLRKLCPSIESKRRRDGRKRRVTYFIPPLSLVRTQFDELLGSNLIWDEEDHDDHDVLEDDDLT